MAIWTTEIKELEKLYESLKGQLPDLVKELDRLIKADDENMILLYSRRCLEVIITDLCECELKRPRKTEPLKGIIDKLHKEEKVPSHIITSMHGLNELSTYGAHPKDFDPAQIKPVLNNLDIIIKWFLKYKEFNIIDKLLVEEIEFTSKQAPEKSIIVLPFENMSSDPEQEYFSDGLTEEIITDLSHINDLLVISRSSAITFKGTKKTIPEIAKSVNVRYVLEGSVRKAGNNLRITAQLIDSINDSHVWAEKYSGTLEDIFDIQERVSSSIANALKIKLSSREQKKIHERPIDNVFAYDCYKRAYPEMMSMSLERLENGLNLLKKGLHIAGENAVIYAGMAFGYFQYVNLGIEHEKNINKAEEFVQKALDLDPELAEAHFVIGLINILNGDMVKSINHLVRAHAGKPEDPEIMVWLALGYSCVGQFEAGRSLIYRCIKVDPINPMNDAVTGWNLFFGGKFNLALNPLFAAYNFNPDNGMHQFWKSLILFYNNRADDAYDFICKFVEEPGNDTWTRLAIFLKYAIKRDKDKLILLLTSDFITSIRIDLQNSYHIATFYSYLGEKEKSLEFLENAVDHGFINYPLIAEIDPFLENIRGEERFKKLMERVKYEWENFEV
jgi:non-specific serine/threonine protein kinase